MLEDFYDCCFAHMPEGQLLVMCLLNDSWEQSKRLLRTTDDHPRALRFPELLELLCIGKVVGLEFSRILGTRELK